MVASAWARTTSAVASEASPRRHLTRRSRTSIGACSQSQKKGTPARRYRGDGIALLRASVRRVNHHGLTCPKRLFRKLVERPMGGCRDVRPIGIRRELRSRRHSKQPFPLNVATQLESNRRAPECWRERGRQRALARPGSAADRDQLRPHILEEPHGDDDIS